MPEKDILPENLYVQEYPRHIFQQPDTGWRALPRKRYIRFPVIEILTENF